MLSGSIFRGWRGASILSNFCGIISEKIPWYYTYSHLCAMFQEEGASSAIVVI